MNSVICISSDDESETKEDSSEIVVLKTKSSKSNMIPKIISATSVTEEEFNSMPSVNLHANYSITHVPLRIISRKGKKNEITNVLKSNDSYMKNNINTFKDINEVQPMLKIKQPVTFIDTVILNDDGDDEEYQLDRHTRSNLVTSVPRPKLVSTANETKCNKNNIDEKKLANQLFYENNDLKIISDHSYEKSDAKKLNCSVPSIKVKNIDSLIDKKTAPQDKFIASGPSKNNFLTKESCLVKNVVKNIPKNSSNVSKNIINDDRINLVKHNNTSLKTKDGIENLMDSIKVSGKTFHDTIKSYNLINNNSNELKASIVNKLNNFLNSEQSQNKFKKNSTKLESRIPLVTQKEITENSIQKINDKSKIIEKTVNVSDSNSGKENYFNKKENEDEILVVYEGINSNLPEVVNVSTNIQMHRKRKSESSIENQSVIKRIRPENKTCSEIVLIDDDDENDNAKEPVIPSKNMKSDVVQVATNIENVKKCNKENIVTIAEEEIENNNDSCDTSQNKQETSNKSTSNLVNSSNIIAQEQTESSVFEEFISACTSDSINEKLLKFVNEHINKLHVRYQNADPKYIKSKSFIELVKRCTEQVKTKPKDVLINFNEVLQELKARQLLSNSEYSVDIDPKKRKHIRKLERTLKLLRNKIKELSEKEIDWDDEENSYYLQEERYKKRCMLVYEKLCELTGENKNAGRKSYSKLRLKCSKYPEINKAVSKLYQRTRQFPNIDDIETCIKTCIDEHKIVMSQNELNSEIEDIFKTAGNILQQRRKLELYENLNDPNNLSIDPAEQDSELLKKLDCNKKISNMNMEKVIKKYVEMQEKGEDYYSENEHLSEDNMSEKSKQNSNDDESS